MAQSRTMNQTNGGRRCEGMEAGRSKHTRRGHLRQRASMVAGLSPLARTVPAELTYAPSSCGQAPMIRSGTRLGPYEIGAPLGAGGMGEVYRARDTKLNRDVAIKVLPESVASDPDRLARFKREAQVLASLNHPNIGQIYGFEDSGATHGLVLELIDGPTLADLIAQGPLPVRQALQIARQIAEALDAAHEQGIVHRDLKPANVKVAPGGRVKLLDFGLAKPMGGAANPELSHSPTQTFGGTQAGVLLGTAAYMSPE